MPTVQDKAEELLQSLYALGKQDVDTLDVTGATATIDPPNTDEGSTTTVVTLAHATPALTLPILATGQRKRILLVQDATGSRVPTYVAGAGQTLVWQTSTGVAPVLQTAAASVDIVDLFSPDGVNVYATVAAQPDEGGAGPITSTDVTSSVTSGTDYTVPAGGKQSLIATITGGTTGTLSIVVGPAASPSLPIVASAEPFVATIDGVVTIPVYGGDHVKITVGGSAAITKVYLVNR